MPEGPEEESAGSLLAFGELGSNESMSFVSEEATFKIGLSAIIEDQCKTPYSLREMGISISLSSGRSW